MTRITKKADERRQEIISTAQHLFRTTGYENTTMQEVMERLNIAKGTIYHYFVSKEALLEAVVESIVEENIAQMRQALADFKGNALEKTQFMVGTGNMASDNTEMMGHLHQAANANLHSRLLAVTIMKLAPLYAEVIQQGCEEGVFQTNSPLECAEFLLSAIQFLTDLGIYPWTQDVLARRVQAFPALIEAQLKAPPGSFQFLNTTEGSGTLQ